MGLGKKFVGWLAKESAQARPSTTPHTAQPPPVARKHSPVAVRRPAVKPAPRQEPTPVILGLDFGTHSTKAMLRVRGSEKAEILLLEESSTDGYPWFAAPSLVRLVGGRLFFGKKATETDGGTVYRSLKVRLLPLDSGSSDGGGLCSDPSPDFLVACYLSWALARLKKHIDARYPYGAPRVFLNMAAPMNHLENEELKTRYLRIIQAAWESVFSADPRPAQQGDSLDELRSRFGCLLGREVPDRTNRLFAVLPETVAPIVSLSLDPRIAPGMYMIFDMGAGTTEVSVNYVGERGADQKVLCYQDESVVLGGNNFEWIQSCGVPNRESQIVESLLRVFRRTWYTAYLKDSPNPATHARWRKFRVLLAGGGARHPEVEAAIVDALPQFGYPVGEKLYHVGWHQPTDIVADAPQGAPKNLLALLSVAHGLSVPRQQWPDFFPPGEIEKQQAPEVAAMPPAYWYLTE